MSIGSRSLSKTDLPVLQRAARLIELGEIAWLGLKIIADKEKALVSSDTDVSRFCGQSCFDDLPSIFHNNHKNVLLTPRLSNID